MRVLLGATPRFARQLLQCKIHDQIFCDPLQLSLQLAQFAGRRYLQLRFRFEEHLARHRGATAFRTEFFHVDSVGGERVRNLMDDSRPVLPDDL